MKVFIVRPSLGDLFEVLRFLDTPDVIERDLTRKLTAGMPIIGQVPKLEVRVKEQPGKPSDYPYLEGTGIPVFSQKAVVALREVLTLSGELIPLGCLSRRYFALNVTCCNDAVDWDASSVVRYPSSGRVATIPRPVFRQQIVARRPLFRIRELVTTELYATATFFDRVAEAGLSGFEFEPVAE